MTRIRLIIGAAIIALIVLVLIFGPAACNALRSRAAQNRLDEAQMEAMQKSAADAIGTQGAANKREAQSENLTQSNEKEIRNAEGASDPVNPAARDAGLRSLCRRPAYRASERCRLFAASSK